MTNSRRLDINGKESSKRTWAARLLWNGIIQIWVCLLIWAYCTIKSTCQTPIDFPEILILPPFVSGMAALGLTLGEYRRSIKPKEDV